MNRLLKQKDQHSENYTQCVELTTQCSKIDEVLEIDKIKSIKFKDINYGNVYDFRFRPIVGLEIKYRHFWFKSINKTILILPLIARCKDRRRRKDRL